jgi:hypothetical protein
LKTEKTKNFKASLSCFFSAKFLIADVYYEEAKKDQQADLTKRALFFRFISGFAAPLCSL